MCQSACTLHPCTVHTCLEHLSLAHKCFRVGSSCATKQCCISHGSGALLRAIASGVAWRPSRSAAAWQQAGMATADLTTLQQQIRQDGRLFCSASVRKCTRQSMGRLDATSSISSAMQRLSAGPAETSKPYTISALIPKSWDGSHDKGQFRNFMAELHLWMQGMARPR